METWAYFGDVHSLDTSNVFDLVLTKFFDFFDVGLVVVELHMNKLNVRIQRQFLTRGVHGLCSGTVHRSTSNIQFERLIGQHGWFMWLWELGNASKLCQNVLVVELIVH